MRIAVANAASTNTTSTAMNHAHHGNSSLISCACGFSAVIRRTVSITIDSTELTQMIFNAIVHSEECAMRYCMP